MKLSLSLSVVFPIFCYLCIGYAAKKTNMISKDTASQINSLMFKLFFPLMMFKNTLSAGYALESGSGLKTVLFLIVDIIIQFLLLVFFVPMFIKNKKRQGAFIQGSIRGNSMLFALPVATALLGPDNLAVTSLSIAIAVPFYNILCVVVLETRRGGTVRPLKLIKSVLTNPLIIGAIAGFAVLFSGIEIPGLIKNPINELCSCITPISLIMLGAGLDFGEIKKDFWQIGAVCFIKLIVWPGLSVLAAFILHMTDPQQLITIFAINCVPTAVATYTMAYKMDSDGPFAGEIVAGTSILSVFTVFLWIMILPLV